MILPSSILNTEAVFLPKRRHPPTITSTVHGVMTQEAKPQILKKYNISFGILTVPLKMQH